MFGDNVTRRLLGIQNEQRAQKVATPLNYGALIKPSEVPSANWSGNVGNPPPVIDNYIAARWIATFTRTDSVESTPFVDFPWDFSLEKSYYEDLIASGLMISATGRDKRAADELGWTEGVYEVGSNYVKWYIDVSSRYWNYFSSNGTGVSLSVQAVSTVQGTLTLERVI